MYDANDQQCKMTTVYCNENESFTYDRKKKRNIADTNTVTPYEKKNHL